MITCLAVALAAQAATATPDSIIRVQLRVHLLRTANGSAAATTRTAASVDTMVAVANTVWRQAGIEWVIESVREHEAPYGVVLDSMIARIVPVTRERLIAIAPRADRLQPGWNAYLIQDFGHIGGGVFLPELAGLILAERGFGYELPAAGRGGTTLAHELGHSLGLRHETCDATRNIMALACSQPGVISSLTPAQIAAARTQALTGRPTTEVF